MKKKRFTKLFCLLFVFICVFILSMCRQHTNENENKEQKTLKNISVTQPPTKTVYTEGEVFSKTGMVVTAHYSDGSSAVITNYAFSPKGALSVSDTSVTISYGGKTVQVHITVNAAFSTDYFSDNFDPALCSFYDKFDGNTLDETKWAYQNGNGNEYGLWGWGNEEKQSYQSANAVVENGILRLEAKRVSTPVNGMNYTSAKLVTYDSGYAGKPDKHTFSQKYGRFEAKIRLSKAEPGMWPAFWMMPKDSSYGVWPRSGELDIMEMKGTKPHEASSTIHIQQTWGHYYRGAEHTFMDNGTFTDWHVYGMHWTADEVLFLIDGMQHLRIPRIGGNSGGGPNGQWNTSYYQQSHSSTTAPFDQKFFIILNLAIGGNYDGGQMPNDAHLPVALEIDWVRVYTVENNPWQITETVPPNLVHTYQN